MNRAAVIQMVSGEDKAAKLQVAAELLRQATAEGASPLVLPEKFALFFSSKLLDAGHRHAAIAGPIRSFLASTARDHGTTRVPEQVG